MGDLEDGRMEDVGGGKYEAGGSLYVIIGYRIGEAGVFF